MQIVVAYCIQQLNLVNPQSLPLPSTPLVSWLACRRCVVRCGATEVVPKAHVARAATHTHRLLRHHLRLESRVEVKTSGTPEHGVKG
jgi:hypothetical protein